VQQMRRQRARTMKPGRPSPRYLLRGLARCRRCHGRMHGTTGGRELKARYYCSTRRADRSCDQPIAHAEQIESQLVQFITGFAPHPNIREEILRRLSSDTAPETSETAKRRTALEERLRRMRDLYELGDLPRPEYIARRDAIHTELSALAPEPIPDLDQARKVLEDFTIFWQQEADPAAKRQFLSLIFEGVWLDADRVVAVQPKPPFLPFFENQRQKSAPAAGVKYGSDGGRTRLRHHRSRFGLGSHNAGHQPGRRGLGACNDGRRAIARMLCPAGGRAGRGSSVWRGRSRRSPASRPHAAESGRCP
jgi:Recombinase zinc beta ribbon domain